MEKKDLKLNNVYRAKKPRRVGAFDLFNDRQIIQLLATTVQYDSPAVRDGQGYPIISVDKFLAWVGEDITKWIPEDDWSGKTLKEMKGQ